MFGPHPQNSKYGHGMPSLKSAIEDYKNLDSCHLRKEFTNLKVCKNCEFQNLPHLQILLLYQREEKCVLQYIYLKDFINDSHFCALNKIYTNK